MADAIGRLLDDPILRKSLGEKGREYVRRERNLWNNYMIILRKLEEAATTFKAETYTGSKAQPG